MTGTLHITSGDIPGDSLSKSGIPGEVFVWHDIMYDGPRKLGWPDAGTLYARARFLEKSTGGGLERTYILKTLITPIFVTDEKYGRIPRVCISCLRDKAISPTIQEQMYSNLPCQRIIKMDQ
jgi:hypothetical protein